MQTVSKGKNMANKNSGKTSEDGLGGDLLKVKLKEKDVRKIIDLVINGKPGNFVAQKFGVSQGHVSSILYLRAWRNLEHTQETVEKWRDWLSAPMASTTTRQAGTRASVLKTFDRNIKTLGKMNSDRIKKTNLRGH